MAYQGSLVRVDQGNGSLVKLSQKEADAFIAANAGAKIVGTPGPGSDEVEMPEQPSEVEVNIDRMNRAQLDAYAAEHNIDISGAKNKDEVIERINAGNEAEEQE